MNSHNPDHAVRGQLKEQVSGIMPECRELRRRLHSSPELSLNENATAGAISEFLAANGLSPVSYEFPSVVCDTGPKPAVALRADMDALPIVEDSGEPFSSRNHGAMHACGHDAHAAILACAGVLLHRRKRRSVRLLFQPAEEIGKGARMMIEAGALDGIEQIFGLHVWPSLDTGTIAVLDGPAMAANSLFTISILGEGGHGAYPHLAHDAVAAAASFIMNANTIVSRNIDPLESAVVSFGQINGGTAANVIPSELTIRGTIRSFSPSVQSMLKQRLSKLLSDACSSFCLEHSIEWYSEGPAVVNSVETAEKCRAIMSGPIRIVECNPTMGSEDFAYYLEKVKGAFAFLGTGSSVETRMSKHSSGFRLDEESMYYGIMAEVLAGENL